MSSLATTTACPDSTTFLTARGFQSVLLLHIFCSIVALVANTLFIKTIFPKIYFHYNIKILIITAICMNCAHSLIYICLQSVHLYRFLTVVDGCELEFKQSFCFIFRYPAMIAMFSFVVINGGIVIERLLATCLVRNYEETKQYYGPIICIVTIIISVIMPLTSQTLTPWTEKTPYCNAVTRFSASAISLTSYCMLSFDAFVIIAYYLVNLINEKRRKCITYDLRLNYQLRENSAVFRLLMPWMIFHFIVFAFFYIANAVIPSMDFITSNAMLQRTIFAIVYIVPEYCALSPLLLWKIYRNQQAERLRDVQTLTNLKATGEAYFKGYSWTSALYYKHLEGLQNVNDK
ncbi:unnamed protein product [Auanema sp. JU1783]|nr:unnamed protein product [Auanema sp. JU1783]